MGTSLLDEDYPSRQGMVTARQDTRGYADKENYDLVIIDTAGHDNVAMRAALKHINLGLVPAGHTLLNPAPEVHARLPSQFSIAHLAR